MYEKWNELSFNNNTWQEFLCLVDTMKQNQASVIYLVNNSDNFIYFQSYLENILKHDNSNCIYKLSF